MVDAIIEYRKNHWWTDLELETVDLKQLKERYMELNISYSWKAAISEDGVIFSFDYNELGLCFAEYCVHALVPYSKLKGLLAPPFDSLVE